MLYQQAQRQSFSVDESRWIATSRYFWITFVEGDVLGPAWQPNYLVLTHPPVARYFIGAGLALQGWSPDELNGRYDTDRSRDFNRRAGNIPSRELLNDARNVVLLFAIGATLLLYPIGRSVGVALGWSRGPLTARLPSSWPWPIRSSRPSGRAPSPSRSWPSSACWRSSSRSA